MLIKKSISTLFILLVVLQGCGGGGGGGYSDPTPEPTPDPAPDPQSIVDVALANGSFTTLIAASRGDRSRCHLERHGQYLYCVCPH